MHDQQSNEDPTLCARCKGDCCRTRPGIESPERFLAASNPAADLAELLSTGTWVLELHRGKPYTPGVTEPDPNCLIRYPRPARFCEAHEIPPDDLPGDACRLLTDSGCLLPYHERPKACRALTPRLDLLCDSDWGRREAALAWFAHQEIVQEACRLSGYELPT